MQGSYAFECTLLLLCPTLFPAGFGALNSLVKLQVCGGVHASLMHGAAHSHSLL
jgi:hypothetical protein